MKRCEKGVWVLNVWIRASSVLLMLLQKQLNNLVLSILLILFIVPSNTGKHKRGVSISVRGFNDLFLSLRVVIQSKHHIIHLVELLIKGGSVNNGSPVRVFVLNLKVHVVFYSSLCRFLILRDVSKLLIIAFILNLPLIHNFG